VQQDKLVISGNVVLPDRIYKGKIFIANGRIGRIGGLSSGPGMDFDFGDCYILPGVIDSHVHFRDPGFTHKEDFETGSKSAAAGGVTTVIDMPNTVPWITNVRALEEKKSRIEGRSYVDYGLSAALVPGDERLYDLANAGALSFEAFTADVPREYLLESDYAIVRKMEELASQGLLGGFYSENQFLWEGLSGRKGNPVSSAKPPISESSMASRILSLNLTIRAPILLRQISTKLSFDVIRAFRTSNFRKVFVEVTPHHLLLDEKHAEKLGPLGKISPPLRSSHDVASVWKALLSGGVDIVSSDHSPHLLTEKQAGSIWQVPAGFPGVETLVPLMIDQVAKGKITLQQVALLMSANPAKIFGLYPRKGIIRVGSNADFTIVDTKERWKVRAEVLHHKCGWTPYEGASLKGKVKCTILAGSIVYSEGEVSDERHGIFQKSSGGSNRR
jgi:dihydroorotase (multifunctional complex type)